MKSSLPKVLHPLCGMPMVQWALRAVEKVDPRPVLVVGHMRDEVTKKPTILLIKNIEDLKFDVMMHKCIRYKHITNLQELLTLELENFKKHPENFQNSI